MLALLALSARQPPTPTIAEFAPQAVDQITDSPTDQSSRSGNGAGDCADGAPCGDAAASPTPTRDTDTIGVARARRCVGDPPRQIEDPQSPPCVPYWSGDNGGATYRGVTRDSITLVMNACCTNGAAFADALTKFFNTRFEFYGRKIRWVTSNPTCDAAASQSEAEADYKQREVFVGIGGWACASSYYGDALVRRRILYVTPFAMYTQRQMAADSPYRWQYAMANDQNFAITGQWACRRLVPGKAVHASGTDGKVPPTPMQDKERVFGIVRYQQVADYNIDSTPIEHALAGCGSPARLVQDVSDTETNGQAAARPDEVTNVVIRMKDAGVTSIFCLCNTVIYMQFGKAAQTQEYYPEWLGSGFWTTDGNQQAFFTPIADESKQFFGLTFLPTVTRAEDDPMYWASHEGGDLASGPGGLSTDPQHWVYRPFLLIASGIQLAGPHLTPQTFERGLQRAIFPNPATPLNAGRVGFGGGSHSMTLDAAEWWWSNSDLYASDGKTPGSMCFIDAGARRTAADIPRGGDPWFKAPCQTHALYRG